MPSGRIHASIAVVVGVSAGLYALDSQLPPDVKIGLVAGLSAGWLMTPDLDLPGRTHEELRLLRHLPVFGRLWVTFWGGYGQFFRHRGLSHWPVLGTLTRAFWLVRHLVFFVLIGAVLNWTGLADVSIIPHVDVGRMLASQLFVSFLVAWMFQDIVHEFTDILVSGRKRRKRARSKTTVRVSTRKRRRRIQHGLVFQFLGGTP